MMPGWTGCDVCVSGVQPSETSHSLDVQLRLTFSGPLSEGSPAALFAQPDVNGIALLGKDDDVVCIVLSVGMGGALCRLPDPSIAK